MPNLNQHKCSQLGSEVAAVQHGSIFFAHGTLSYTNPGGTPPPPRVECSILKGLTNIYLQHSSKPLMHNELCKSMHAKFDFSIASDIVVLLIPCKY